MKNKSKRIISVILSILMTFALLIGTSPVKAKAAGIDINNAKQILREKALKQFSRDTVSKFMMSKYGISGEFNDNLPPENNDPEQIVRVVVETEGIPYVQANPDALKIKDANTLKAEIDSAESGDKTVISAASALRGAKIRHSYGYLFNGFSMEVKRGEIEKIKSMPGVRNVTEATAYTPDMKYAKMLTQALDVWDDLGYKGEGMVVAIVDTGIDVGHKDMVLTDSAKAKIQDVVPGFTIKVPYGYNFADNNDDVKDLSGSMHGMHVAGIVGSNGSAADETNLTAVRGVAPEAQLLAMKVFSNDPNNPYAYTDDLIAAIEDSVIHGADVINMSLGSAAGFQDPDDPEQKAIKNAVDAGVMVVVSAGNEYYSTYPYNLSMYGAVDTSVIGSPGLADDALQVASFNNSHIISTGFDYTYDGGSSDNAVIYSLSEIDPVGVLNAPAGYELVDCGLGKPEQIPDTVAGKIALIERGELDFVVKKLNAQEKGAVGVIVYNNRVGELVNMVTDPRVTIPAVFITQDDGQTLRTLIVNNLKVFFNGNPGEIVNPVKNEMSDFTSWGPTPNLDFKPEITAPGGSIYSTVNDDKYESMSGTSMAAPHTSGAEALILQSLDDSITGRDRVEFAKAVTINTAAPITNDYTGLPYSPRRQGSGLIQIENAIESDVTVTDDGGSAAVALGEIEKTTTYILNIKNYGDTPVTYTLGCTDGVLTDSQFSLTDFAYDEQIPGASIDFDNNTIDVPASADGSPGNAQVEVTITLPNDFSTHHYVEGFISLSPDDGSPALVSPFMGYYGNWSELPVVDAPMWDFANTIFGSTCLTYEYLDGYYYLGYAGSVIDPTAIGISPDGDGYKDSAIPALYLLRNAKDLRVKLLDQDLNRLRDIASYADLSKNLYYDDGGLSTIYDFAAWDGKLYDPATGKYVTAPEGQYFIEVDSSIDFNGASVQSLTMPVKVDLTAPQITVLSDTMADDNNYTLRYTLQDADTSIEPSSTFVVVNGQNLYTEPDITVDGAGVYSCTFNIDSGINEIYIYGEDSAGNSSELSSYVALYETPFHISFDNLDPGMEIESDQVIDGVYTVTGTVNYGDLNKLQLNGVDADIQGDLSFSVPVVLNSGFKNKVHIYVEDLAGNVLVDYSMPIYYDGGAPVVDLTSPVIAGDGCIYTNQDTLTLEGTVADSFPFRLYINGDEILYNGDGDGTSVITEPFTAADIPVTDGCIIEVRAVDGSVNTNEYTQSITVRVDKDAPEITISGVENGGVYTNRATPVVTITDSSSYTRTMTLDGNEYDGSPVSSLGEHTLAVNASDLAGNASSQQVTFTIIGGSGGNSGGGVAITPSDTTPPTVITTSGNIKVDENIVVEFSETVQKSDKYDSIAVTDSKGKNVAAGKTLSGNKLTLNPQADLLYGETYTVKVPVDAVKDMAGNKLAQAASIPFTTESQDTAQYYRLNGNDRYETCAAIVQEGWETSDYAVLVTGENYPDALSAAPLAKKYDAPILITASNTLTPVIEAEISRLNVKNVFIVGGEGAVSKDTEDLLKDKYTITAVRIAGSNRGETSARIAEYLDPSQGVVVTSGDGYADALSIASFAASKGMPILLAGKDSIPQSVSAYISNNNVNKTYIVGGYGMISEDVEKLLPNPTRYAGTDRYNTNAKVIKGLSGEFNFDTVYIATGENFADALSGAALAAKTNSPIILVSSDISPETMSMVKEIVSMAKSKYILGGEASIGSNTLDGILK